MENSIFEKRTTFGKQMQGIRRQIIIKIWQKKMLQQKMLKPQKISKLFLYKRVQTRTQVIIPSIWFTHNFTSNQKRGMC